MARLARVLKTDIMADLDMKGLAQVLRSRGRNGDTMLAHITPKEARKLKREGGAGTVNPDTGLPEFFDFGADYGGAESYGDATAAMPTQQAMETYQAPDVTGGTYVTANGSEVVPGGEGQAFAAPGYEPLSAQAPAGSVFERGIPVPPAPTLGGAAEGEAFLSGLRGEQIPLSEMQKPTEGFFDRLGTSLGKSLQDPATLARLGLGIGGAGLGFLQQQRGAKQAKQAQRQIADIAAPYQTQGKELIDQARRGELSPASMQAYQAAQAQAAQSASRQGGVGTAQAAATLERLRAQLLDNQYNLGLRVANIGDAYMRGAIQTGMQANQALNQASTQFFTNLASTLSGPTVSAAAGAAR